jgi:hypothetical protein
VIDFRYLARIVLARVVLVVVLFTTVIGAAYFFR